MIALNVSNNIKIILIKSIIMCDTSVLFLNVYRTSYYCLSLVSLSFKEIYSQL